VVVAVGQYPINANEFERRFRCDDDCYEYLAEVRWGQHPVCSRCQSDKLWKMSRGEFRCGTCDYQFSLTAGTLFHDLKKPILLWFRAMWHVTEQKHGVSALGLQRALGLGSYHTAWTWLHKLRKAMVRPGRDRLSGDIEVDETFVGGPRPWKRGRGTAGKELVLIMAQKNGQRIGRVRLQHITDASAETLMAAIKEAVEPGSVVCTDGWGGYSDSALKKAGYGHRVIRAGGDVGDNLLPLVNLVASLFKRWLLGTHQGGIQPSYLPTYLNEFAFRFNRRTSGSRGMLFYRLIQHSLEVKPITLATLRTKG